MATQRPYLDLDPRAVDALLRGRNGPVVRELVVAGEIVRQEARRLVGVSRPDPVPRAKPRRPGTLRDSIVARIVFKGRDPTVLVGSEDPIALLHHEGTRPHTIVPRRAQRLVFYWPKKAAIVAFPKVSHPGTRPNPFLTNALKRLRGRY